MPLAWKLAQGFRKRRHQSGYLSFMSMTSITGIGLGCFVLIVLLSVMNGFERELTQRLLAVIPHGELFSVDNSGIANWQSLQAKIAADNRVEQVIPYTPLTGLLQKKGNLKAVSITGIAPDDASTLFANVIDPTSFAPLHNNPNAVILGQGVMEQLALDLGDRVTLLLPQASNIQQLRAPKRLSLTVAGQLALGGDMDAQLGFIHIDTASQASGVTQGAKGLRISTNDPFDAPEIVRSFGYQFVQPVFMSDWTRTHGHIFQDIQLVRIVVYIVLILVIAVACFNVVSTLVMSVKSKQTSIAILMSMGATPNLVKQTFLLQGLTNGLTGTAIGVGLALLVTPALPDIVFWIEQTLNVQALSSDVYFVDFLPTELHSVDVVITAAISLTLSILAAWYPATRAARVQPASVLS